MSLTKRWTKIAEKELLNKRIIKVEYMEKDECEDYLWDKRPITFFLDDGTRVIAQMDDEGNDGGVLACITKTKEEILPVLSLEDK
tara:strand:- start:13740 stop:13994 length:255 start_codon:yes stop_codon:yes gene_type:complete